MQRVDSRSRIIIEAVRPEVNNGRFPAKRVIGENVIVEADIFADGHDVLCVMLLYRKENRQQWHEILMSHVVNDSWRASFKVTELGTYLFTILAWVDRFESWRKDFEKRITGGNGDISVNLNVGIQLLIEAGSRATKGDKQLFDEYIKELGSKKMDLASKVNLIMNEEIAELMHKYDDRQFAVRYPLELSICVDPKNALYSTWYEMFPRSTTGKTRRHGTFKDCETRLPYIADMGFDVLYFPPIHPIGKTNRKGKNNSIKAKPDDPGTPWAIGSNEGGHTAIHLELGDIDDFQHLVKQAKKFGIDIALDLAFQCSPDHPYVKQHPEWFRWRPDGTIQYAENPPKRYQDIYPLNFETDNWQELWEELKKIVFFWLKQGIRIFRVDNPHTKPFKFWEWLIGETKKSYPEVIFLAEAFTRPKVMYQLAKLGFSQSYTYFAWRNSKWELMKYFQELNSAEIREYFRPNLWPNTPDILTDYLQSGGRPAFMTRLVLASTLGASYGIYGPAYELCVSQPKEAGSEEYLDSEKYEIRTWDMNRTDSLKDFISLVNKVRKENAALQSNSNLHFYNVNNDQLICYGKHTDDLTNIILTVVNLDPYHTQSGWIEFSSDILKLQTGQPYQMHDILSGARFLWYEGENYVELDPNTCPAHIFVIRRRIRSERDFDYFM